jgi:hypothetical protein
MKGFPWKNIGIALACFVIFISIIVWFTKIHPVYAYSVTEAPFSFSLNTLQASAIAAASSTVPVITRTGVVTIDESQGLPGTPYISYQDSSKHLNTEELIFDSNRGCQISAGEADCAPNLDAQVLAGDYQYPVTPGETITVTGAEIDQTFHVQEFSKQSTTPPNMVVFSTNKGNVVQLSDGLSVQVTDYSDSAKCILGSGCFGNGTPQDTVVLSTRHSTSTTIMIPGLFTQEGNDMVSLLSVSASNISTFLVAVDK